MRSRLNATTATRGNNPGRFYAFALASAVLVFGLLSSNAIAQTTTSTIEGTVVDTNGAAVAGAQVKAVGITQAFERSVQTNASGFYRIVAVPAGNYKISVSQTGFADSTSDIELTLNRVFTFNVEMQVEGFTGEVDVTSELPLVDPTVSAPGTTVTPRQITELPVNGRDYLDLLQLVPGVAINRQADSGSDNANPVLGERSGNNNFLIDGQPNKDTVNGGPAAQFNQETIAEFQVLTSGYKAEFGQASGAVVNVITKSGGNGYHGVGSLFYRNDAFDSSNSLDSANTDANPLDRYDFSVALGGPIIKDKVFFFASAERITEDRVLNFAYPDTGNDVVNQLLRDQESAYDNPSRTRETRGFLKLNEQINRHQLSQEFNYTNGNVREYLPLSASQSLPSARNDRGARNLLIAGSDTFLVGDEGNPAIVTLRAAYRGEPSDIRPSHPDSGAASLFVPFSANGCCILLGDLPTVNFGNPSTGSNLDQEYTSFSANVSKLFGDHNLKFGWNYLRTKVNGFDSRLVQVQLFSLVDDFANYNPLDSGISLIAVVGGNTPEDDEIHLKNNYNGLFIQDDWSILRNLTINYGVRWDHDSEFEANKNFSPRVGVAWAINPKTVVRGNFGIFYDQFRLGLARNVPAFGGTDRRNSQSLLFPRGLYGSPSFVSSIGLLLLGNGPCLSNGYVGNLTDAQITAANLTCPLAPGLPFIGVDRLNNVVAAGHAPIPANTVITVNNIQALSGLTPEQYLTAAAAAVGQPDGYFNWGAFGYLSNPIIPPDLNPTVVDQTFKTPNTLGFSVGVQREIAQDMVLEVDYYHREIRNLLGVRYTNLAYQSRLPGMNRTWNPPFTGGAIFSYGPYFEGKYDALIINFNKRMSNRFMFGASYTYSQATDNSLGINTRPSDNFVGTVPVVTETATGATNANGSFIAANGNFIEAAGTFLNGPDLDKGPSDLSLDHVFQANGLVVLPWQIQISGIFRVQSGFHFSKIIDFVDPDGDGNTNQIDTDAGRNAFTSPTFANLDMRFSKRINLGERVKLDVLFEFFNMFNRQNPAAVERREGIMGQSFGGPTQVLPGREGQIGVRVEF